MHFAFPFGSQKMPNRTPIWMANRDYPVNGRRSELMLMDNGNLNLTDAGYTSIWSSNTRANSSVHLHLKLLDSGNLVLATTLKSILWQSFDFPTNTLLPGQLLTGDVNLVSSRSATNHSSGFCKLYFDNDNMVHLPYDSPEESSAYWPDPSFVSWDNGRTVYNSSRVASYDSRGYFNSSDNLNFKAADSGFGPHRRLTLDFDGNLRMYSLQENGGWTVTWQALNEPCNIPGACGANNICSYDTDSGRKCTCVPGYRIKDSSDWSQGCEPEYDTEATANGSHFLKLPHTESYGYDYDYWPNATTKDCRQECLSTPSCKVFLMKGKNVTNFQCYIKTLLLNGHTSPVFHGTLYVKLRYSTNATTEQSKLLCQLGVTNPSNRDYQRRRNGGPLNSLLWFAGALGVVEFTCILMVWVFLVRTQEDVTEAFKGDISAGFDKFSYAELKQATSNFKEEIGKGGSGSVYKGVLRNGKVVAIKRLINDSHGQVEFPAELNVIGRLNHMNLIKMWGYCLDGTQRLLVLDFMKRGSLADNLYPRLLTWDQRYAVALGAARGLAYLHEECLEWILHCDVKPENILLDSDYQVKVADFGLSKLLKRDDANRNSLSGIRGTRGYMAPEWVSNAPITSKVDVYSYGVVMLEIITGKSPIDMDSGSEMQNQTLVTWVREKKNGAAAIQLWIKEIADQRPERSYDIDEMKTLALCALQCVEKDKDMRPTMRKVVEMLQEHKTGSQINMQFSATAGTKGS